MKSLKKSPKKLTLRLAKAIYFAYHSLFPSSVRTCRFDPTCSRYLVKAVEKYGVIKGFCLFTKRLTMCHPFSNRPLLDPVP